MVKIKQAPLSARIGTGIGQGLAQQIPQEIERYRLSEGLKNLGQQQGQNPFQQFAGLAGIPGITPQMLQSGSELLRQQAYIDALRNPSESHGQGIKSQGYTPSPQELSQPLRGEIPTLSTPEATRASYTNAIPPSYQQERQNATENFTANPLKYRNNFENALNEQEKITSRNKEIQQAYTTQDTKATEKESNIKTQLANEVKKLGANIPAKSYEKLEERAINAILPKSEGGEGLQQEQALKKYALEADQANRNYRDLESISAWSPLDFHRRLNNMQKQFEERGDTQQLADELIKKGYSPIYSYHLAQNTKNHPEIKQKINKIPFFNPDTINPQEIFPGLKKAMGKKVGPLSIAYDLEKKGYNPRDWINYLDRNRDNLEVWQADQLNKNINLFDLNDLWLELWEGK